MTEDSAAAATSFPPPTRFSLICSCQPGGPQATHLSEPVAGRLQPALDPPQRPVLQRRAFLRTRRKLDRELFEPIAKENP